MAGGARILRGAEGSSGGSGAKRELLSVKLPVTNNGAYWLTPWRGAKKKKKKDPPADSTPHETSANPRAVEELPVESVLCKLILAGSNERARCL